MVLDGRTIVEKNYVTFPNDREVFNTDEQVQPNGVDLRAVRMVHVQGRASLPVEGRIDPEYIHIDEIPPKDGWFELDRMHGNYLVDFRESVSVPDGFCAIIITRSSLVRVGVDLFTGLWDTGFQGKLGASIRLRNPARIQYGARMGQVMFHKSTFNGHRYTGAYAGTTQSEFALKNGNR